MTHTPSQREKLVGSISDGYHTFDELYEHRHALFVALTKQMPLLSWRARKHADGSMFPGWFIAGIQLPTGQISYHLPGRLWGCLDHLDARDLGPPWDGHTQADVPNRLYGLSAPEPTIRAIYEQTLARIEQLLDAEFGTREGDELDVLTDLAALYEARILKIPSHTPEPLT